MMKKRVCKVVALVLLVVLMAGCLSACKTKLNGTYTSDGLVEQSFTFKDDDVVVISAFGINAEGTYEIEDDTITITYKLLGFSYDWEESFERDGKDIIIGGTKFVKE